MTVKQYLINPNIINDKDVIMIHNHEVGGSSPPLATKMEKVCETWGHEPFFVLSQGEIALMAAFTSFVFAY